jgi:TPR repeat protein
MSKAVQLLKVGVSHGYPPAEVTLGDLYARGDGVPKDCAQARTLLQSGARSGSPEARRMLAKLKSEGCP